MNIKDWIKSKLSMVIHMEPEEPVNAIPLKVNPVHIKGWMKIKKFTDTEDLTNNNF